MAALQCIPCKGTGSANPDCPECGGLGMVEDWADGGAMITCSTCANQLCKICEGSGEQPSWSSSPSCS